MRIIRNSVLLLLIVSLYSPCLSQEKGSGIQLVISSRQAYYNHSDGPRRPLTISFKGNLLHDKGTLRLVFNGKTVTQDINPTEKGIGETEILLPAGEITEKTDIKIALNTAGLNIDTIFTLLPARFWTLYFLPHSHNDIGYTHVQEEVMKLQWQNLEKAIELCRKTQLYPDGSQYRWNSEVLWAIENYFKNAPEENRKSFIDAVQKGWVGLDGMYANMLTGLCRQEELMHIFDASNKIQKETGTKIETAMITDVPGYAWGTVTAMAQNGIRYFSVGPNFVPTMPNQGDRVGLVHKAWGDIPFYWLSPSGNEKILYWSTGKGYSWFHKWIKDRLSVCGEAPIFEYLGELTAKDYPYDLSYLRYTIGGDNGPPDEEMPDFVRKWNEKYAWPKIRIGTTAEVFKALEEKYSNVIPVFRGDFTPYWEDGAASSAKETAINRHTADKLVQADILWTILKRGNYPVEKFYDAWQNVLLYSEHTWGAHNSISNPFIEFVKMQWDRKQRFALSAEEMADKLMIEALSPISSNSGNVESFQVFNTSSWLRSGMVTLPADWKIDGKILSDKTGNPLILQKLSTGEWVFIAKSVPPLGSITYYLKTKGRKLKITPSVIKVTENTLANDLYEIVVDKSSGNITSLLDRKNNLNFAGSEGLNSYSYTGKNGEDIRTDRNIRVSVKENGPVLATLLIESDAPGTKILQKEITIFSELDWIGLKNIVDKEIVTEKENVRFGFPFNVEGGDAKIDLAWGVMQPEKDQLKGSNKNFFTMQNWIDINNNNKGITLFSQDAPIVEIGGMNGEKWMSAPDRPWTVTYTPSSLVYSWVMNNSWHTNYRAYQNGITEFRYALKPHSKFNSTSAKKTAEELCRPLIPVPTPVNTKSYNSMFIIDDSSSVIVSSIKETSDGGNVMIRLFNTSEKPSTTLIKWNSLNPETVYFSDPKEATLAPCPDRIEFNPFEVITLKIKR